MPKQARVARLTQNLLHGTVRDLLRDAYEQWQAVVRKNQMRARHGLEPALRGRDYLGIIGITIGWSILGFFAALCVVAGLVKIVSWLIVPSPPPKPDIIVKTPRIEWWSQSIPERRRYSEWTWRKQYSEWLITQQTKGLEP